MRNSELSITHSELKMLVVATEASVSCEFLQQQKHRYCSEPAASLPLLKCLLKRDDADTRS